MKTSILLMTLVFSVNTFAQTAATISAVTVANAAKKKNKKEAVKAKAAAPCDTKEDVLKKLEEQKKAASEDKTKGFSLQGGNTGCSVK
jgi:hypothetical protein